MSESFESVQVGDEIYFYGRWNTGGRIAKVSHVTPTTFCVGSLKFRKKDGREIGGSRWNVERPHICTDEHRAQVLRASRIDRLSNKQWAKASEAALAQVCAILDAEESTQTTSATSA
jgi:hypothetical protein